ncbi:hypothetical protein [Solimicrobium silvestre]|uniref:Sulfatase-modifying factor enzyme domain-containing protein n=1 Tax=Solimicrobium silvestre TaxID=2099400 RepID=A0A2S9GY47_9BURK|nr:hypothetical protein [Solimicrobium silvestre]PRC92647.1 hypothetical protein S2091_2702 [Solimicrobium silvestre]
MNAVIEKTELNQAQVGLYKKFTVARTDGSSEPGGKHEHDEYFVLNLTTDKHALPALKAYAKSCASEFPILATNLRAKAKALNHDEYVTVPETTLPNGVVVPEFKVGKYITGCEDEQLAINAVAAPWVEINFHDAKAEAEKSGLKLITETQYLAIAHNIAQQAINWTSGVVGEGSIFQGIRNGDYDEAQPGTFVSEDETERRWHELSNGERVFDFAGNCYSWIFDDVQGDENGIVNKEFAADSPSITTAPAPSMNKGCGWYPNAGNDWSGSALVRGGCWDSGDYAGVFLLYYGGPACEYGNVGFRCTIQ